MEEELFAVIDAAVAFSVAWGVLGEGTATPRAMLSRASAVQEQSIDAAGIFRARVNADVYGKSYAETITAARAIRAALNRYQGGTIQGVFFENARDMTADDAGLLYRVGLTFSVVYAEA